MHLMGLTILLMVLIIQTAQQLLINGKTEQLEDGQQLQEQMRELIRHQFYMKILNLEEDQ